MENYFPGIWRARGGNHLVVPRPKEAAPAPVPQTPELELFQDPFAIALDNAPQTIAVDSPKRKRKRKRQDKRSQAIDAAANPNTTNSTPLYRRPDSSEFWGSDDCPTVSYFDCED